MSTSCLFHVYIMPHSCISCLPHDCFMSMSCLIRVLHVYLMSISCLFLVQIMHVYIYIMHFMSESCSLCPFQVHFKSISCLRSCITRSSDHTIRIRGQYSLLNICLLPGMRQKGTSVKYAYICKAHASVLKDAGRVHVLSKSCLFHAISCLFHVSFKVAGYWYEIYAHIHIRPPIRSNLSVCLQVRMYKYIHA